MLHQRNDGRLEFYKFYPTNKFHYSNQKRLQKNQQGEFWIQTKDKEEDINWLVDICSPRSFISRRTAQYLITKLGNKIVKQDKDIAEFRCFKHNKIKVDYSIQLDLVTSNTTAHTCQILVIPQNTVNILGRDNLQKLGIELTYKTPGEKIHYIQPIQNNIAKWIFEKNSQLCTRIGKSKNHIAKSTFKFIPPHTA